jgi:hypothetical protein
MAEGTEMDWLHIDLGRSKMDLAEEIWDILEICGEKWRFVENCGANPGKRGEAKSTERTLGGFSQIESTWVSPPNLRAYHALLLSDYMYIGKTFLSLVSCP